MAEVELVNIIGHYGHFLAVDDVSFKINSGEFVTLLGPSGCGKSSTLRIVAGLLKPTAGRVLFEGRDVTALAPAKRNIGMVFQSLALFPHMTVAENVAFGLEMKGVAADVRDGRVKRTLDIVRLGHLADRFPAQLSGGQQQRVALARAVVIQPSILILDEPFGALDRKLREAMQVELHGLTRELGITALFVTHDQEEALMLSDVIAVMNAGKVEQFGRPSDIYRTPSTPFVADFMGVTNLLRGRLSQGKPVIVAVRPEKIAMSVDVPSGATGTPLGGRVKHVTYHGHGSRYVVQTDENETIVVIEPTDLRPSLLANETRVWLSWHLEDALFYPSEAAPAPQSEAAKA